MSNPVGEDASEPIYIIYSGLDGKFQDIKGAFNLPEPAIRWCKDELKALKSDWPAETSGRDDGIEVSRWSTDEDGNPINTGFTIVERVFNPLGLDRDVDKQVHVVCNKQSLEIEYITTDHVRAIEVCDQKTSSIVKSVDFSMKAHQLPSTTFPKLPGKDGHDSTEMAG
ncbi:MAG: hypothetical protein Q9166_001167 [cf. Caloplaca sp. 2 TL-2023]